MSKVKKCPLCGQLFPDMGIEFCLDCSSKVDDQFMVVREYLYEHPNASIEEVAEETEIPSKLIVYFLKDGRLRVVNSGLLKCEQCGASIDTGRFCDKCSQKFDERIVKPLMNVQKRVVERGPRMHTYKSQE